MKMGAHLLIIEKLFSHLLFYSGYLAATICNEVECTFVAPNYEVRHELN